MQGKYSGVLLTAVEFSLASAGMKKRRLLYKAAAQTAISLFVSYSLTSCFTVTMLIVFTITDVPRNIQIGSKTKLTIVPASEFANGNSVIPSNLAYGVNKSGITNAPSISPRLFPARAERQFLHK